MKKAKDNDVVGLLHQILKLLNKLIMNDDQLLALLQNDDAELGQIATGVNNLLSQIANSKNVPQNIQDSANKLKTDLDTVNKSVGN